MVLAATSTSELLCYPLANEVVTVYINATVRPSFRNILMNYSRINILQWILTNLGTDLSP